MASLNRVFVIGNLTRDVETRVTQTGETVAKLGVAVGKQWTGKDGQLHKQTHFFDVTAWSTEAINAGKYLRKGSGVCIDGELVQETWEDKTTGEKRSKVTIRANNIQYLDKANRDEDTADSNQAAPAARTTSTGKTGPSGTAGGKPGGKPGNRPTPPPPPGDDEDLPF